MGRYDEQIRALSLFAGLDEERFEALAPLLEVRWLGGGEVLFHEGDVGDALYAVLHGRLRVALEEKSSPEPRRVLGEVGRGQCVGELALLSKGRRAATVRAVRDSLVLKLPGGAFEQLMERSPGVAMQLCRVLVGWLSDAGRKPLPSPASALVLVPAGRIEGGLFSDFVRDFVSTLSGLGRVQVVDWGRIKGTFGEAILERPEGAEVLARFLQDVEADAQYTVIVGDVGLGGWTQWCIRQADRIVLVGHGRDPGVGEAEAKLHAVAHGSPTAREELVRLYSPDERRPAKDTAAWLGPRQLDDHHHVRLGHRGDLGRLARCLTGRAVTLCLGGGGMRGYAHLGVLRALEEAQIPIDAVCGTSIGAFLGAQFAARVCDARTLTEQNYAYVRSGVFDPTLPLVSLLHGGKVGRLFRSIFLETHIEDLWTRFMCVASDLTLAKAVIFDRGLVRTAVRASTSIPGVFPPVVEGDRLLVDGGVLNNLPADVLRERFVGSAVIAVDVAPRVDLQARAGEHGEISGWSVLGERLKGRGKIAPGLMEIIARASTLASLQRRDVARAEHIDLYIDPPVGQLGTFELKAFDAAVEAGYRRALGRLEGWRAP